jgi:hypothetical protein
VHDIYKFATRLMCEFLMITSLPGCDNLRSQTIYLDNLSRIMFKIQSPPELQP